VISDFREAIGFAEVPRRNLYFGEQEAPSVALELSLDETDDLLVYYC
jgi:hypothetical protein